MPRLRPRGRRRSVRTYRGRYHGQDRLGQAAVQPRVRGRVEPDADVVSVDGIKRIPADPERPDRHLDDEETELGAGRQAADFHRHLLGKVDRAELVDPGEGITT